MATDQAVADLTKTVRTAIDRAVADRKAEPEIGERQITRQHLKRPLDHRQRNEDTTEDLYTSKARAKETVHPA